MNLKVLPTTNTNEYRVLSEKAIDTIVGDLLDSYARFGLDQTRAERESETARIARKRKVTNLQVGGIRSNLSRGAYGSFNNRLKATRKVMNASS